MSADVPREAQRDDLLLVGDEVQNGDVPRGLLKARAAVIRILVLDGLEAPQR